MSNRKSGATGPNVSSRAMDHLGRDLGQHRRLEETAAERDDDARRARAGRALRDRVVDVLLHFLDGRIVDERSMRRRPSSRPGAGFSFSTALDQPGRERVVDAACTSKRFAQTHVCPVLRYLDAIAPSAAASRSASSNTMNGALPPSSSESFFTVAAHCAISSLPTAVEPVNESLRTVGFDGELAADLGGRAGHHVEDPVRQAGALGELGQGERGERRLRCGFEHDRAAGGKGRRRPCA